MLVALLPVGLQLPQVLKPQLGLLRGNECI